MVKIILCVSLFALKQVNDVLHAGGPDITETDWLVVTCSSLGIPAIRTEVLVGFAFRTPQLL